MPLTAAASAVSNSVWRKGRCGTIAAYIKALDVPLLIVAILTELSIQFR
jgi:hypothetical protein